MRILCLVLALHPLTGCATVFRGTQESLIITTEPIGAIVSTTLETRESKLSRRKAPETAAVFYGCAATPCEIKIPRKSKLALTVTKDGYHQAVIHVEGTFGAKGAVIVAGSTTGTVFGTTAITAYAVTNAGLGTVAGSVASTTFGLGVIGLGVDMANGSLMSLSPKEAKLVPEKGVEPPSKEDLPVEATAPDTGS